MKKVLFVATVVKKHINVFHIPYLKWFKENGYETHVCARDDFDNSEELNIPYCDHYYNIPFERSPFKIGNFSIYKELKKIIEKNNYDIIHCHTPMGGALSRLAARNSRKSGTSVIYTAHGFHFFKGSPLKNWVIFYPIEKWLSKYTDCLITINKEDYDVARKKFKVENIKLINGVGVNVEKFKPQTEVLKLGLRKQYGYEEKDFIIVYAGELSYRKHQDLLIDSVSRLTNFSNVKLLLIGTGDLLKKYQRQVDELGISNKVEFLGFRNDVNKLMMLSDVAVSSSRQEGLPVNIMEAMATGLPLIVTDSRGNRDLVKHKENGFLVGINDVEDLTNKLKVIYQNPNIQNSFSEKNLKYVQKYSLKEVLENMKQVYKEFR